MAVTVNTAAAITESMRGHWTYNSSYLMKCKSYHWKYSSTATENVTAATLRK